jgi:hypothetical protein
LPGGVEADDEGDGGVPSGDADEALAAQRRTKERAWDLPERG